MDDPRHLILLFTSSMSHRVLTWYIRNHLCVGPSCQVYCKVKIDFIGVPTYFIKTEKGH